MDIKLILATICLLSTCSFIYGQTTAAPTTRDLCLTNSSDPSCVDYTYSLTEKEITHICGHYPDTPACTIWRRYCNSTDSAVKNAASSSQYCAPFATYKRLCEYNPKQHGCADYSALCLSNTSVVRQCNATVLMKVPDLTEVSSYLAITCPTYQTLTGRTAVGDFDCNTCTNSSCDRLSLYSELCKVLNGSSSTPSTACNSWRTMCRDLGNWSLCYVPPSTAGACITNPTSPNCADYSYERVDAELKHICGHYPDTPVCSIWSTYCNVSFPTDPNSVYCNKFAIYKTLCNQYGPKQHGCADFQTMCNNTASVVKQCNLPVLKTPEKTATSALLADLCPRYKTARNGISIVGGYDCDKCLNSSTSCDRLGTYSELCKYFGSSNPSCAAWRNLCTDIPNWPVCVANGPSTAPPLTCSSANQFFLSFTLFALISLFFSLLF